MNHLKAIVVILFILLVIVVAVQNYQAFSSTVTFKINLIFFKWESAGMSLYFVAIVTFLVGVFFTGFYGITERFRLKRQIRILMKEAKEKDQELNSLRNLPVTSEDIGANRADDTQ